jgi:hypothetical protein
MLIKKFIGAFRAEIKGILFQEDCTVNPCDKALGHVSNNSDAIQT